MDQILKQKEVFPAVAVPKTGQFYNVSYNKRRWLQKAIALVTKSDFTHSGIVGEWDEQAQDFACYEAEGEGFSRNHLSKYDGIATLEFSDFDLTADEIERIEVSAQAYLGIPYSFLDIFCLLLSALGFTPTWVFKRLASPSTLICSESVAKCFLNAGISLIPGLDVCRTTPADLHNLLADTKVPKRR